MPFDDYQFKILAIHLRELDDHRIDVLLNYDALRALPDEHLVRLLTPSASEAPKASLSAGIEKARGKAMAKAAPAAKPKAKRSRKAKATAAPLTWGGDDAETDAPAPVAAKKRTRKQPDVFDEIERDHAAPKDTAHADVDDRLLEEVSGGHTTMRALREQTGWGKSVVERGLKRLVADGRLSSTGKRGMGGGYALTNGAAAL